MRTCNAFRAWLVFAAVCVAAPALAFEPTPEVNTPNDAYRFGMDAYRAGDHVTALDAFEYAAAEGHVRAKWMVGRMYSRGEGVERDDGRAFEIFADIAEENGDDRRLTPDTPYVADAYVALGNYYRDGDNAGGVNPQAALQMYWDAATYFNDTEAQYNLAVMFYRGEAGDADPAEAARWALRAAQAGNASAQALLGYLLFQGDGVERQPVVGLAYLHFAYTLTEGNDPEVRRLHEEAMALASENDRRTAIALAQSWLAAEQGGDTTAAAAAAAAPAE